MTLTPLLVRVVAIAGGLSLAVAGGFAAYNSLSGAGAALDQSLMVPVAFTDASGQHTLLADLDRPAELRADPILHDRRPNVEAVEQAALVAPAPAPPVMTAPDTAVAAAVPANLPPPASAVTIVRPAPAPAVAVRTDDDEHQTARANRDAERAAKRRGRGA